MAGNTKLIGAFSEQGRRALVRLEIDLVYSGDESFGISYRRRIHIVLNERARNHDIGNGDAGLKSAADAGVNDQGRRIGQYHSLRAYCREDLTDAASCKSHALAAKRSEMEFYGANLFRGVIFEP